MFRFDLSGLFVNEPSTITERQSLPGFSLAHNPVQSGPVVGMAGQNGGGAIELLCQHDAHQLMRPCKRPEGQHERGVFAQARIVTIGTADGDDKLALTAIALIAKSGCKVLG